MSEQAAVRDQRKGYVYVLSNPAMPGLAYIGHTGMLGAHYAAQQLFGNNIPEGFVVEFEMLCARPGAVCTAVELELIFSRVNRSPNFFRVSIETAITHVVHSALNAGGEDAAHQDD